MPSNTIADSQGLNFSFGNGVYELTNVKSKTTQPTVDASTLTLASGSMRKLQAAPLKDPGTVTIEGLGTTTPTVGAIAALNCSTLGVASNAVCEEVEITAAVGELLKFTASFKLTLASS